MKRESEPVYRKWLRLLIKKLLRRASTDSQRRLGETINKSLMGTSDQANSVLAAMHAVYNSLTSGDNRVLTDTARAEVVANAANMTQGEVKGILPIIQRPGEASPEREVVRGRDDLRSVKQVSHPTATTEGLSQLDQLIGDFQANLNEQVGITYMDVTQPLLQRSAITRTLTPVEEAISGQLFDPAQDVIRRRALDILIGFIQNVDRLSIPIPEASMRRVFDIISSVIPETAYVYALNALHIIKDQSSKLAPGLDKAVLAFFIKILGRRSKNIQSTKKFLESQGLSEEQISGIGFASSEYKSYIDNQLKILSKDYPSIETESDPSALNRALSFIAKAKTETKPGSRSANRSVTTSTTLLGISAKNKTRIHKLSRPNTHREVEDIRSKLNRAASTKSKAEKRAEALQKSGSLSPKIEPPPQPIYEPQPKVFKGPRVTPEGGVSTRRAPPGLPILPSVEEGGESVQLPPPPTGRPPPTLPPSIRPPPTPPTPPTPAPPTSGRSVPPTAPPSRGRQRVRFVDVDRFIRISDSDIDGLLSRIEDQENVLQDRVSNPAGVSEEEDRQITGAFAALNNFRQLLNDMKGKSHEQRDALRDRIVEVTGRGGLKDYPIIASFSDDISSNNYNPSTDIPSQPTVVPASPEGDTLQQNENILLHIRNLISTSSRVDGQILTNYIEEYNNGRYTLSQLIDRINQDPVLSRNTALTSNINDYVRSVTTPTAPPVPVQPAPSAPPRLSQEETSSIANTLGQGIDDPAERERLRQLAGQYAGRIIDEDEFIRQTRESGLVPTANILAVSQILKNIIDELKRRGIQPPGTTPPGPPDETPTGNVTQPEGTELAPKQETRTITETTTSEEQSQDFGRFRQTFLQGDLTEDPYKDDPNVVDDDGIDDSHDIWGDDKDEINYDIKEYVEYPVYRQDNNPNRLSRLEAENAYEAKLVKKLNKKDFTLPDSTGVGGRYEVIKNSMDSKYVKPVKVDILPLLGEKYRAEHQDEYYDVKEELERPAYSDKQRRFVNILGEMIDKYLEVDPNPLKEDADPYKGTLFLENRIMDIEAGYDHSSPGVIGDSLFGFPQGSLFHQNPLGIV